MKKIALILLAIVFTMPTFAQGKFGKDSAECIKYLSYYKEYMKQKDYKSAASPWRQAYILCPPTASQNLLIDGQRLMRHFITQSKDAAQRKGYIDTLLNLHEQRATVYPKYKVTAYNNKALDIINYKYNADDNKALLANLLDIMKVTESKSKALHFVKTMEAATLCHQEGTISADEVMAVYTVISRHIDMSLQEKEDSQIAGAQKDVETLLADSGVATCEKLEELYAPRYEATPQDNNLLTNIVKMLGKAECFDSKTYLNAAVALHQMDPTHNTAYFLYKLYSSHSETEDAISFLSQAIEMCENDNKEQASDYALELGTYAFKSASDKVKGVEYAKKAAELDETNKGKAYLLIGTIWATVKCPGNELEVRTPFWVAYDYVNKAKAADPTLEAEADNLMVQYRKYFPAKADAFMFGAEDGHSYTVSAEGLREVTVVRTNK
jgi:tetratricopeptide (TPR) repeat protein